MQIKRRFIVVGHRAHTVGDFNSKDLCGGAGRWDVLVRCVNSSFFLSHALRKDTELMVVALGPTDAPKTVRFCGPELKHLNPDEWTTGALVKKALDVPVGERERPSTEGIFVSKRGLSEVLGSLEGPVVYLHEHGDEVDTALGELEAPINFVLGDDKGLEEEEEALLKDAVKVSLGPEVLHSDHCIVLVHNVLDRLGF